MNNKTIQIENCELCVIGMGIAGINALNSSSSYLSKKDKVIVIDRRESTKAIGGMWNAAYPFVRLHQPHSLFTIGNKKWGLDKDPGHLANREEVIGHFNHCYTELKERLSIIEMFAYEYQSYEEVKTADGYSVHISFQSINEDLPLLMVKAKRCIKAFGFNILPNDPMKFSSNKVKSITPESPSLLNCEVANDDKPIYIVGGGKSSMDVANFILAQNPNRKLNFIIGRGTYFLNRDILFPSGAKKNWTGTSINKFLLTIALLYDEKNIESVIDHIKNTYGCLPFKDAKHTVFGLLSPHETNSVKKSIDTEVYDYIDDVVEKDENLYIRYKNDPDKQVVAGSWFILCTGYLYSKKEDFEPVLSPHEKVLSINNTASTVAFTSLGSYFLPHLWFRNKFKDVPINQFNHASLIKKDKEAYLFGVSAQAIHNLIYFVEALPFGVVYKCGANFDKWFPLHRQFLVLLNILINKKRYLKHTSEVLDRLSSKYDVESKVVGRPDQ